MGKNCKNLTLFDNIQGWQVQNHLIGARAWEESNSFFIDFFRSSYLNCIVPPGMSGNRVANGSHTRLAWQIRKNGRKKNCENRGE